MKIKSISVEALFGIYNHTIDMSEHPISIVLGDNGLGKTTIFRMVYAFFNKNYSELLRETYELMTITFDNDIIITISPDISNNKKNLKITFQEGEQEKISIPLNEMLLAKDRLNRRVRKRVQSYSFNQEDILQFSDYSWEEELMKDSFIESIIGDMTDEEKGSLLLLKKLDDLQDRCNVIFVKAQRILTPVELKNKKFADGNTVYRESLEIYSEDLKEKINATKAVANDKATQIDGSFPERLLEKIGSSKHTSNITLGELNDRLKTVYDRQEALSKLNLIRYNESKAIRLRKWYHDDKSVMISIIQTYINDMNEKLSQYDSLFRKLRLFVDLANGYMSDKELDINTNGEISISYRNKPDKPMPLSSLSSGEQNLLVLLYNLIFIAKEHSIVLLDEPEISLHVVWQRRFVDDIIRIIEINPLQICLATHSPSIIGTHWNLTQEITNE